MVLKLYAAQGARGGAAIVALVLLEKGIPVERVIIDTGMLEHRTPEHRARNPWAQLPVIDDEGFVLYETRAICRYLCEKYDDSPGPRFLPADGICEGALFEQAASVELANFNAPLWRIREQVFAATHHWHPRHGTPIDESVMGVAIAQLELVLDVYEGILGKQKYLVGDDITLVDIFHLHAQRILAAGGLDLMTRPERPNVQRWWNALISRPVWIKLNTEGIQSTNLS